MRVSSRIAVGSPTMRLVLAMALITLLVASFAAVGAGSSLLTSKRPGLPEPYGPARNGVIAFSDGSDILATDADGQEPRVLVAGPEIDTHPIFSHDGTHLAFLRDPDGPALPALMVAAADGSDVREVLSPALDVASIDWSPDGTVIAVARLGADPRITLVDTQGGSTRDLVVGDGEPTGWLAWRPPHGEELLFLTSGGGDPRMYLYAIHPDGSGLRQIARGDDLAFQGAKVSSDGSALSYWNWEADEDGFEDAWGHVLDLATGDDRRLPEHLGIRGFGATFSPDARLILYEDYESPDVPANGPAHLYVVPTSGDITRKPVGVPYRGGVPFDADAPVDYQFSPDGSKVLVALERGTVVIADVTTGSYTETAVEGGGPLSWQRLAAVPPESRREGQVGAARAFVRPFDYELPAGSTAEVVEDSGRFLFSMAEQGRIADPLGGSQTPTRSDGRGVLIVSVLAAWFHGCGGDGRLAMRSDPAGFLADLVTASGGTPTPGAETVDGRHAQVATVRASDEGCSGDLHYADDTPDGLVGPWIDLRLPARMTVLEVGDHTVLIDTWARTDADLADWLPTADAFIGSIHFHDAT